MILVLDHEAGPSIIKIIITTKIDSLATEYDLKQVINKPIHSLENCFSYIDLMLAS